MRKLRQNLLKVQLLDKLLKQINFSACTQCYLIRKSTLTQINNGMIQLTDTSSTLEQSATEHITGTMKQM